MNTAGTTRIQSESHVDAAMLTVIVRPPSPALLRCELTYLGREPIDAARAVAQHHGYRQRLRDLGARVVELPAEPELADATFVEDPAVVVDELAIIARPGATSRRPECGSIADALRPYRELAHIEPPGTLEGGDVLVVDRQVFVGQSTRTNRSGFEQLAALLAPLGYRAKPVLVHGCLHLKTGCTYLGRATYLANPAWIDARAIATERVIAVDPEEPFAANAMLVGERVVMPQSCPRTIARIRAAGFEVHTADISELMKAEAGLTCLSLRFDTAA